MAYKKPTGVKQYATGTGTTTLTLGAAVTGEFRTLDSAPPSSLGNGDYCYVRIRHETIPTEFANCKATFNAGGTITLAYDAYSSPASPVNWTAGNKIISASFPGEALLGMDTNGDATIDRDLAVIRNLGVVHMAAATGAFSSTVAASSLSTEAVNAAFVGAAWTDFTPTVTAASGTITTLGAVTGRYKRMGKLYLVHYKIPITTNGTGAGYLIVSTPNGALPLGTTGGLVGHESNNNLKAVYGRPNTASTNLFVINADGTYPGLDGANIVLGGLFEAA